MCCIVLQYIALYGIVLHCFVLYCIVLHCFVSYYIVLYCMALHYHLDREAPSHKMGSVFLFVVLVCRFCILDADWFVA